LYVYGLRADFVGLPLSGPLQIRLSPPRSTLFMHFNNCEARYFTVFGLPVSRGARGPRCLYVLPALNVAQTASHSTGVTMVCHLPTIGTPFSSSASTPRLAR